MRRSRRGTPLVLAALLVFGCGPSPRAASPLPRAAAPGSATTSSAPSGPLSTWFVPFFDELDVGRPASPDGALALARTSLRDAFVFDLRRAAPVAPFPRATSVDDARFSADGRRVATVRSTATESSLVIAELDGPPRVATFPLVERLSTTVSAKVLGFLPDGRHVAVDLGNGSVVALDASDGRVAGEPIAASSAALAPSAGLLAYTVSRPERFRIVEFATRKVLFERPGSVWSFVWHGRSPRLVVRFRDYALVWTQGGAPVELPRAGMPYWDTRGERVAVEDERAGMRCASCLRPFGAGAVFDAATGREVASDGFVPDGPRFGVFQGALQDRVTGEIRALAKPPLRLETVRDLAWDGDGTLLVATMNFAARIELATGRVSEWDVKQPGDDFADFDVVSTCESGHFVVQKRFGRAAVARFPDKPCSPGAHVYPLSPSVFEYVTDAASEMLDGATGATLARFEPSPLASPRAGSLAFAVREPKRKRCRVFDGGARRVLETPILPEDMKGLDCHYFGDGFVAATDGLVAPGALYLWSEKRGFVTPSGAYSRAPTPFCRNVFRAWNPAPLCVERTPARTTLRRWDPAHGVRLAVAEESLNVLDAFVSSDGTRLAVRTHRGTFVADFTSGLATRWGDETFAARRFGPDGRTLYGQRGPLANDGALVPDDLPLAARDAKALDPVEVAKENAARAKPPLLVWSAYDHSPSGAFAAYESEPLVVARPADGRFVRVVVASVGGRPRSLVVDEAGRFAGDAELEPFLAYASGTSLRDAVLRSGADVAAEFRRPEAIRGFFGARAGGQ